jgi:hypothetical protein
MGSYVKLYPSMKAILNFQSATKKTNLVEDHPFIISTMLQFLSDKKIFKLSAKQNTLLALAAILDSGSRPSKEHSYNAKKSICRVVSHIKVFQ